MLTGLILWRIQAGNHCCSAFMTTIVMSFPDNSMDPLPRPPSQDPRFMNVVIILDSLVLVTRTRPTTKLVGDSAQWKWGIVVWKNHLGFKTAMVEHWLNLKLPPSLGLCTFKVHIRKIHFLQPCKTGPGLGLSFSWYGAYLSMSRPWVWIPAMHWPTGVGGTHM